MTKTTPKKKTINLALQGGGAHGAFTWGVLDALLEDGRIDFEGVSATSAGAMNAAALAYGKTKGDSETAREVLENFWHEVSRKSSIFSQPKNPHFDIGALFNPWMSEWTQNNVSFMESLTRSISPYQFNPLNLNLLKDVLEKTIDFDHVHACDCMKLFITTTDVQSGLPKIFENQDVTQEVLLASAALPTLFQAVEIKGRHYWDGGYLGNPSLWPLFYHAQSRDILLVHVNPIKRDEIPKDSQSIDNRLNEITFNASLLKELRAIDFVQKLLHEDMLKDEHKDRYKDILLHAIRADDVMRDLSATSKFDTDWSFLTDLRDSGRKEAKIWLKNHFKDLNKRASVDIQKDYLAA